MSGKLENMTAAPPAFTAEDATWIAWQKYGIHSMARPLDGERDLNFRLTDAGRRDYVLKIWNSTQDPAAVQFMLAALAHVAETDPELPVARVLGSVDGDDCLTLKDSAGEPHPAALLSWLDGTFMRELPATDELKSSLGHTLARLDRALADFRHPAQDRELLWDICRVEQLREMAGGVENPDLNTLVLRKLDEFAARTQPALAGLRRQVIHNDFNPDNVLVDPADRTTVRGIIDFGDIMHAPLICELAVAGAYQVSGVDDPVDDLLPMVKAYHAVYPLEAAELDLLPDLVGARLLCTMLITTRMVELFPENREYLLGDTPQSEQKLRRLDRLDPEDARRRLRAACGLATRTKP